MTPRSRPRIATARPRPSTHATPGPAAGPRPGGATRSQKGLGRLAGVFVAALAAWLMIGFETVVCAQERTPAEPGKASLQIELGGHSAPVRRLAVSTVRGLVVTAGDDKTARVWDLRSQEIRQILRPAVGEGETGRLYGAAFSPDGNRVAVAGSLGARGGGHAILVFDPGTGRLITRFDARGGDIKDLAYTPDGALLLAVTAGDNRLRAFDAEGRLVSEHALAGLAYGVAVSADGRVAASTLAGTIHLFQGGPGGLQPSGELRGSGRPVSIGFSPDGARLVAGYFDPVGRARPEVFDLATGRVVLELDAGRLEAGNLMTVGYSGDGSLILAAGTGYRREGEHALHVFDARDGRPVGEHLLATNTILDLAATGPRSSVFAAFDGTWGSVDLTSGAVRSTGSRLADLRGPRNLRINDDASLIGFSFDRGATFSVFDVARREIRTGPLPQGLSEPRVRRGFFGGATWENERQPKINGADIALAGDEVGRSIAFLHDRDDALFGTSKGLMAVNADGGIRWRSATDAEVLAINVRRDNRLALTAMSDGTIRWWRIDDGRPVLTLLPRPDGRWAMFAPGGSFDASAGADRIVGWAVNREDGTVADFFSLNRFRDRYNRPEVIDNLLGLAIAAPATTASVQPGGSPATDAAAPATTVQSEPAAQPPAQAQTPAPQGPAPGAGVVPAEPPRVDLGNIQFPPVLSAVELTELLPRAESVRIPFTIRAKGRPEVEVRVDGRPARDAKVALPASFTGRERAIAELSAPRAGAVIQIIARDDNGVSEPLGFKIGAPEPARPAPLTAVPAVVEPVTAAPGQITVVEGAPQAVIAPPPARDPGRAAGPRLFVLAIGISEYARQQYQLGLAAKDARDFVHAVETQRGRYYSQVQTRVLTDGTATREAIRQGLDWLASEVGPEDVGMLFMAGHGVNAPDGQYYFMPHEGRHEQLAETSVPEQSIRTTLGRMRGKALFFVDTCYAGNALGNFRTASRELAKLANNLAASENGVIVFASSSGRQLSEENDAWGNGAFTKALIEGLSGKADLTRSGRITYKGLDYFVSEQVSRLTDGRQTPVTISPVGVPDFAIASVTQI